jgi:hypothetical protein
MTDTLITILVVFFAGYQIEVEYPSRSSCGEAILAVAKSDLNYHGKTHSICVPLYAPTVSYRPVARGERP